MFFFFFFNSEQRIGFKRLTNADLGLSDKSHQSHIGLYEGVLEFLDDEDVVKSAMLLYDNYCDILDCTFDRIKTPEETFRSPKIRVGTDSNNSIVSQIRSFAKSDPNAEWYLAWTGLESKELVFWLIKSGSKDYDVARKFFNKNKVILNTESPAYKEASKYLLERINFTSQTIQSDLEVKSQIGDIKHIYKRIDIEKADKQFKETGRLGEELIAKYLEKEKFEKKIESFLWENKSRESGLPYDFIINDNLYIDVKSTRFDFNQYLFFSSQEIEFVLTQNEKSYMVYRIFDINNTSKRMQICNDCLEYMLSVKKPIDALRLEINNNNSLLKSITLGTTPDNCFKSITEPIIL